MKKYFSIGAMFVALLSTVVIVIIIGSLGKNHPESSGIAQEAMIDQLIHDSREKKTLRESLIVQKYLQKDKKIEGLILFDKEKAMNYITRNSNYTAYHLLFFVKTLFPSDYNDIGEPIKASVLCSALENTTFLNDWGYLDSNGSFDGEAATLLLEVGKPTLKYLALILKNKGSAPLYGSEEATLSSFYRYRRSDFAFRYISIILGLPYVFYEDLNERDKAIEGLEKKLLKIS